MFLEVHQRRSDSPYVERVWHSRSNGGGRMTSIASTTWDLVFWDLAGQAHVTVHGPETHATHLEVPAGATFFGISFTLGTAMPHLPPTRLVDRAVEVPNATAASFPLAGSGWERPDDESVETFVARLVRAGIVIRDPFVATRGASVTTTLRTIQRRFRSATGLTPGAVRQIERARRAAVLLRDGRHVTDVVDRLGYYDGPHLRRSLTRFIGRTPALLKDPDPVDQMSLLYTT
ncbi:AraC family transcriptional regulator [Solicola gregarius]|uniref:Helix-turn-helix domain-containing protein n=1 Tax=Solicola gregarius TaxID=2908642 RepID=A0AA46TIF3_9ACTN|nr:helix-turn-helix domain-containing protein [Solicola gregarius]UYM05881.1 helix-turn-helix domain-containing protein [Solicola gregarius]